MSTEAELDAEFGFFPKSDFVPSREFHVRTTDNMLDTQEDELPTLEKLQHELLPDSLAHKAVPAVKKYATDDMLIWMLKYRRDGEETLAHSMLRVARGVLGICARQLMKAGRRFDRGIARKRFTKLFWRMVRRQLVPAGRGLDNLGTAATEEHGWYMSLCNCAFVSTKRRNNAGFGDSVRPYVFTMHALTMGTGVGADVEGADQPVHGHSTGEFTVCPHTGKKSYVYAPKNGTYTVYIPDSREGWALALAHLLISYFEEDRPMVLFDYSKIRAAGTPLKRFGGIASGPDPLRTLLEEARTMLEDIACGAQDGSASVSDAVLGIEGVANLINMIGRCVVTGGGRRSAEILLGPNTPEFLDLKNYAKNPHRAAYGWASNNSVVIDKLDREEIKQIVQRGVDNGNGEPGLFVRCNVLEPMFGPTSIRDEPVNIGPNPCGEMKLWPYEVCNLQEGVAKYIFHKKDGKWSVDEDMLDDMAFLGAVMSTIECEWTDTAAVMRKNHRIGMGISGWMDIGGYSEGLEEAVKEAFPAFRQKLNEQCDVLGSIHPISCTTCKPGGTACKMLGCSEGASPVYAEHYIQRIRLSKIRFSEEYCKTNGIPIREARDPRESDKWIAEFYRKAPAGSRTTDDCDMAFQIRTGKMVQKWADASVSNTRTWKEDEEAAVPDLIADEVMDGARSVAYNPHMSTYTDSPKEKITQKEYRKHVREEEHELMHAPDGLGDAPDREMYCDGGMCTRN